MTAVSLKTVPAPVEHIAGSISMPRGQRVLLDTTLAELYGVSTKVFSQAVKRNTERFPVDFMFRLDRAETGALNRSPFVTGSQKHRDPRFPPFAFTEHGAILAATVLSSSRAVEVSIYVVAASPQKGTPNPAPVALAHSAASRRRGYATGVRHTPPVCKP